VREEEGRRSVSFCAWVFFRNRQAAPSKYPPDRRLVGVAQEVVIISSFSSSLIRSSPAPSPGGVRLPCLWFFWFPTKVFAVSLQAFPSLPDTDPQQTCPLPSTTYRSVTGSSGCALQPLTPFKLPYLRLSDPTRSLFSPIKFLLI